MNRNIAVTLLSTLLLILVLLIASSEQLSLRNVPGGKSNETDRKKIADLLQFLGSKLSESQYQATIQKVARVERQIVNGMNYFITLHLIFNNDENKNERIFEARIYETPNYLPHEFRIVSLIEKTDSDSSTTIPVVQEEKDEAKFVPGGRHPERNFLKIVELVNFLSKRLAEGENGGLLIIRKILHVEKQVVNGVNYFVGMHLESLKDKTMRVMEAKIYEPPSHSESAGELKLISLTEINAP
ncbi:hypothetical protein FDP41_002134 [Naegleria fowleri]|uniref:Cystatin domain-containing protein n=1 Tax=Naegleria fowleri TaxID=5763 RepID=A0A6A5BXL1_NAEFO|nr:uncharacterized protein FDP41_002134 [Naegleria fowleri]KAF0979064.1 hypothetical protein FDP41_002134 [Naegleria fowleri]CAG4715391.1 unnamed protein product [Naegleria fowleri]